jgi:hypothetical protein
MRGRYLPVHRKALKHRVSEYAVRNEDNALKSLPLVVDPRVKEGLRIQSVLGRIRSGHAYINNPIPEATFEEVCDILGKSPGRIKRGRQKLVYGYKRCLDQLLKGNTDCLVDGAGFPIFGVNFLKRYKITDAKSALKGVVLGLHDSSYWRNQTVQHYKTDLTGAKKLEIGYGYEFLIDQRELYKSGGSLHNLEERSHSRGEIERLREKGVIIDKPRNGASIQYIRLKEGLGTCDDASLLTVGKMYGPDALVMGFLMDATDTYEKHITHPVKGGVDEQYAEYVLKKWKKKYKEDLLTPEDIMRVIYLGAKNNSPLIPFSSSHRRFVERPQKKGEEGLCCQSTVENHLKFLNKGSQFPCRLGFEGFPSDYFYNALRQRWKSYEERFKVKI